MIQLAFASVHHHDEDNGKDACVMASDEGCSAENDFVDHSADAEALGSGKECVVSSLIGFAMER